MRVLGFWMKVLAALVAAFALMGLGYDIENHRLDDGSVYVFVLLGFLAWLLVKLGDRWHDTPSVLELDVAARRSARPYWPTRHAGWLPHSVWQQLPDPLPGVPDVTGNPAQDVPAGDVPPDQTLRHLWLVRAQLAAHLDTQTTKARMKYPGVDALVMVSLGLAGCAAMALVSTEDPPGNRLVVGPVMAGVFLLWPFTRSLVTCTEVFRLVAKRKQALKQAEAYFMGLDAQRPGGPLGGPAVQAGELPYVPPSVPPGRLP